MGWQLPPEHVEALKHPLRCFQETELKRTQLLVGSGGKPLARKGKLSQVYQARAVSNLLRWAVKCYREEIPTLEAHYRQLTERLAQLELPYLLPFQYVDNGLRVRGCSYPIVKMAWADGIPLNVFVEENADRPKILYRLADQWLRMAADLRRAGVTHGCLQHDHVLVNRNGPGGLTIRLIDYDAMCLPSMDVLAPPETGHPNYEHPRRLWQRIHDADSDRFPQLVIYTAVMAVAANGRAFWERHDNGDNLLFKERDFQEPTTSSLFRELCKTDEPGLRALAGRLLLVAQGSGREVPLLESLVAEAGPPPAGDPLPAPRFALSAEQQQKVKELLSEGPPRPTPAAAPAPVPVTMPALDLDATAPRNPTFGILIEDDEAPAPPKRPTELEDDNFDLIVDEDPALTPPARPKPPPLPAQPPPLPAQPPPLPGVSALFLDDPYTATYNLEAWMPEQVAVKKVQGFVDSAHGEVVTSIPGLMRVRLLDPYEAAAPKPGLLGWLGFVDQTQQQPARVLAVLDFHMRHKETTHQKLLGITLEIRPGDNPPERGRWRTYCDRLYCEVRGFLMGYV
jgi:hypothetical protein